MAANLSSKLTLDGTQHNDALRTAAKELSKYKREVANTDKQLRQFKNQSKSATGAISTFAQSLKSGNIQGMMIGASGATNALGSSLVKLGGWMGVAMGATEMFTKAIHSSQDAEDKFGSVQAQVTTTVDNFFSALTTGDFSSFLNGIDSITKSAKEAFEEMDNLWNMAQSFGVKNARLNNKFQKNLIDIRKLKDSDKPEDKKRVEELKKENKAIIQQQKDDAKKLYNQTIKGLQTKIAAGTGMSSKISESAIYKIAENDINSLKSGREQFEKEYNEYLRDREKLDKQAERKKGKYFMGKTGVNYRNSVKDLEKKHGTAIAANYLLKKLSDEELASFYTQLNQAISYESASIANSAKMVKFTKEDNKPKTTKRSGKTNKPEEEQIGLIQKLNAEIQKLNIQKEKATSIDDIKNINNEIEKLEWKLESIKKGIDPEKMFKNLGEFDIPNTILSTDIDLENIEIPKIELPNVFEQYQTITGKMNDVLDAYDIGMIGSEKAKEFINEFNAALQSLGLKPIEVHIETNAEKKLSEIGDVIGNLSNSFSSLGDSLEMPALNAAGIIGQAIANIILAYSQALAMASKLGPWAWIAFGLGGLAQVAGIISQIHSLSGYADGGIVGGNRTMGDHTLIRANAGEMMLNTRQQAHLFSMLDGGTSGTDINPSQVVFTIKGNVLQGVLDNYNNKMNKVR